MAISGGGSGDDDDNNDGNADGSSGEAGWVERTFNLSLRGSS